MRSPFQFRGRSIMRIRGKRGPILLGLAVLALPLVFSGCGTQISAKGIKLAAYETIKLPGKGGHGDLVEYDSANKYLYVAHHGDDFIVINTDTNKVLHDITVGPDPNGVAFDSKYVYVTVGTGNTLTVIDKSTWQVVNQVKTEGTTPDGLWLDSANNNLYLASDDANDVEVYSSGNNPTFQSKIALQPATPKSGPDVGVLVASKNRLYMPDDSLVEMIDLTSGQVTKSVDTQLPVTAKGATKGMAYDPSTNRLWVATTAKKVLVFDADTLQQLATLKESSSGDEVQFDPTANIVVAFGGKGFDVYDAKTMKWTGGVKSKSANSHTGAIDTFLHDIYLYEGDANVVVDYMLP